MNEDLEANRRDAEEEATEETYRVFRVRIRRAIDLDLERANDFDGEGLGRKLEGLAFREQVDVAGTGVEGDEEAVDELAFGILESNFPLLSDYDGLNDRRIHIDIRHIDAQRSQIPSCSSKTYFA